MLLCRQLHKEAKKKANKGWEHIDERVGKKERKACRGFLLGPRQVPAEQRLHINVGKFIARD
jgi:hypothetical protein